MIFRKEGKPTSHLFDVRDAIASTRVTSATTAAAADHRLDGAGKAGNFDWIGSSSSRPFTRTMSAAAAATMGDHHHLRWRGGAAGSGNTMASSDPVVASEAALGSLLEVRLRT